MAAKKKATKKKATSTKRSARTNSPEVKPIIIHEANVKDEDIKIAAGRTCDGCGGSGLKNRERLCEECLGSGNV